MNKTILIFSFVLFNCFLSFSQEKDTVKTLTSLNKSAAQFERDTLLKQENSPLDIGDDRGIYILTKDGQMQLRILGSVRFSLLYDLKDIPVKKTFNTYYIPVGEDSKNIPNYYGSLNQTRIGFEINRQVGKDVVFIRLETDFNGKNGAYRIRHAYGEVGRFLVGQTWSLFSNVSSLPTMVNSKGPTGSVTLRTAQMRYSDTNRKGTRWAAALEYSRPDLNLQQLDTTGFSVVQIIPDVTARIEREGIFGAVQLSVAFTTVSIRDQDNNVSNFGGYGGSLSGDLRINEKNKILYQLTYGKSISHFITNFAGTGNDVIYNPNTGEFDPVDSFGGFLAYGFTMTKKIKANASIGYADLSNEDYQPGNSYRNSFSGALDCFWQIAPGARLGVEYIYGTRWNKDSSSGSAGRLQALFYYDF